MAPLEELYPKIPIKLIRLIESRSKSKIEFEVVRKNTEQERILSLKLRFEGKDIGTMVYNEETDKSVYTGIVPGIEVGRTSCSRGNWPNPSKQEIQLEYSYRERRRNDGWTKIPFP